MQDAVTALIATAEGQRTDSSNDATGSHRYQVDPGHAAGKGAQNLLGIVSIETIPGTVNRTARSDIIEGQGGRQIGQSGGGEESLHLDLFRHHGSV